MHAVESDREGLAGRGDLDQQRVVERRDRAAGRAHARVEAHAEAGGTAVGDDLPVVRGETIGRVLRGHAALHGKAVARDGLLLGQGEFGSVQACSRRNEDLRAHEVDAGDLFGHGVLDLNARVHLDEEPLVAVVVVEELNRACVVVTDAPGDFDRRVAEVGADFVRQIDRRGDLDNFLVAALHRAVALVQVKHFAVRITEDLHFDVLGPRDVFFEKDGRIAEGASGLVAGLIKKRREIAFLAHHAHAAPAATEGRFDDERETDFLGDFDGLGAVVDRFFRAGEDRNAEFDGQGAGRGFVAHHFEQFRPRADEGDAGFPAGTGKVGVLGEKSVARMDHVHTAITGQSDDALDIEVGTDRPLAAADHVGLVGFEAVDGEAVFLRVNRDGPHVQLVGRPENTDSDLAAVGHEQGFSRHVEEWLSGGCLRRLWHGRFWGRPRPGREPNEQSPSDKALFGRWPGIFSRRAGLTVLSVEAR